MEPKASIHLSKPLLTYGSSYKYGLRILDTTSTPVEILDSGPNRTADIMALYLERTSYDVVVFFPLTWSDYRHFLKQNSAIQQGSVKGATINLKYLGIGNGLTVQSSILSYLLTYF